MSAEPLPNPSGGGSAARIRRAAESVRRPVLSLVPAPVRARKAPFVALVLGILLAGLLGLLLLNTVSAQDAFRLHRLQTSAAAVADERQALSEQVDRLTGPAGLAARAAQLGMVPGGPPQFWRPGQPLPPGARVFDGTVIVPPGGKAPAPAPPKPAATAPTDPTKASVTAVPRPLRGTQPKAGTTSKTGTTSKAATSKTSGTKAGSTTTSKPGGTKRQAGSTSSPTAARSSTAARSTRTGTTSTKSTSSKSTSSKSTSSKTTSNKTSSTTTSTGTTGTTGSGR